MTGLSTNAGAQRDPSETGLERATSGVTGRSWRLRGKRG
jgi:hypothetical protein